jgi:hypothetical protein
VAFVTDRSADLADGVDELDSEHPLGGGELDLASKVVDVLDQRAQDHARTLVGLGAHGIDHVGSEVGVEARIGRHFVCMVHVCPGRVQVLSLPLETGEGREWIWGEK